MTRCLPARAAARPWMAALLVAFAACAAVRADDVIPADPAPRWWKGNTHTHTFWSDGDDFPEMVAEWYRTHGYHFLGLSDHNLLSEGSRWRKRADLVAKGGPTVVDKYLARFGPRWVERRGTGPNEEIRLQPLDEFRALVEERGRFLMIPAEEISDKAEGGPVHLNALNLRDPIQPVGGATVVEAITNNFRAIREQAERSGREILAHLNHPNFHYAITAEDLAQITLERYFEVYNGHPGVNHLGDEHHPGTERLWDIANTIRLADLGAPPLLGVATDDSHNYHGKATGSRPGRGWVMVRATHLTPERILRAMRAGDYYASSGVTLAEVRFDAERRVLELEIAADEGATYTTEFIGTLRGVETSGTPPTPTEGEKQPGRATRRYSDQIGVVLSRVEGTRARYELTGQELYVRAVVTSSRPPRDPSFKGQRAQAWTQPVGWSTPAETEAATGQ